MLKLKGVISSLLLTVILLERVNGVPIAAKLPTEFIPIGISAPFTCPAEMEELLGCTVCSISKNAIDEVIVGAVTDSLVSDDTTGDAASVSLSQSVSAAVLEKAFIGAVPEGIALGDFRGKILEIMVQELSITDSRRNDDFFRHMEITFETANKYDELEKELLNCVGNYLADSASIKRTITNAVSNAIVRDGVSPNTVASIDAISQELVPSIKDSMKTVDSSYITSILNTEIYEAYSRAHEGPAAFTLLLNFTKGIYAEIDKDSMMLENIYNIYLQAFGESPVKLSPNLITELSDILNALKEPKTDQKGESDQNFVILDKNYKISISKLKWALEKITEKSRRFPEKNEEILNQKLKRIQKVYDNFKNKVPLLVNKLTEEGSSLLELPQVSNFARGIKELGLLIRNFTPVANTFNYIREISSEDIKKVAIDFLSRFDFINREDLEESNLDGLIDGTISSQLLSEAETDYILFMRKKAKVINEKGGFNKLIHEFNQFISYFKWLKSYK